MLGFFISSGSTIALAQTSSSSSLTVRVETCPSNRSTAVFSTHDEACHTRTSFVSAPVSFSRTSSFFGRPSLRSLAQTDEKDLLSKTTIILAGDVDVDLDILVYKCVTGWASIVDDRETIQRTYKRIRASSQLNGGSETVLLSQASKSCIRLAYLTMVDEELCHAAKRFRAEQHKAIDSQTRSLERENQAMFNLFTVVFLEGVATKERLLAVEERLYKQSLELVLNDVLTDVISFLIMPEIRKGVENKDEQFASLLHLKPKKKALKSYGALRGWENQTDLEEQEKYRRKEAVNDAIVAAGNVLEFGPGQMMALMDFREDRNTGSHPKRELEKPPEARSARIQSEFQFLAKKGRDTVEGAFTEYVEIIQREGNIALLGGVALLFVVYERLRSQVPLSR
mmetsp:Transcript_12330/g.20894  ORF Transcript_12330/g.20894 Transcript_12330/m.20894 type:complete len:397 (+) Transcript_12330:113-1303(+)